MDPRLSFDHKLYRIFSRAEELRFMLSGALNGEAFVKASKELLRGRANRRADKRSAIRRRNSKTPLRSVIFSTADISDGCGGGWRFAYPPYEMMPL